MNVRCRYLFEQTSIPPIIPGLACSGAIHDPSQGKKWVAIPLNPVQFGLKNLLADSAVSR